MTTDQNIKRTEEVKEALEIAKNANKVEDLFEQYSSIQLKIEDALILVVDQVKKWSNKYPPSVCKDIDRLFYMNLQDVYIQ